jgi:hypothetical protein
MIKSRRLRWAGHVAKMGEGMIIFKILTDIQGKIPIEGPRSTWEDNIRMHLKEICVYMKNWIDSAQD